MSGKRTSVYLGEEVLASAHRLGLNVSEVCQRALEHEVEARVESLRSEIEAGRQAARLLEDLNGAVAAAEQLLNQP